MDEWLGWYWVKWVFLLMFKLMIDIPFIIAGPIVVILKWSGLISVYSCPEGVYLACLFACFCIRDLIPTILVPWRGGDGRDWPVWMEDWKSWKDYKHEQDLWIRVYSKR